ncbi:hypothetical protein [Pseudomonas proteolytica]|uniref:hypothetical protein n=1 Tax=Pseudomonas proteolytica TaxID=219574 RepID=UPI0014741C9A|nr:hypothetical protein [Pseudomonas proteolytica]NMZ41402.1 hypothetical protein [Pseudomonas proteolytica]
MDPISMISGAASTLLPLVTKGLEMGMDALKELTAGAGDQAPGKIGGDQQQQAPVQINF